MSNKNRERREAARARGRKPKISERGNILMFDRGVGLDRKEMLRSEQGRLMAAERLAAIGMRACSVSHDMRHWLSPIYANAELLERHGPALKC